MHLSRLDIAGFKSFAKKTTFDFGTAIVAVVGPNGSGKSNVAESIRFVLGEQSMKSMRGKRGEDLIWNGSTVSPRANRASVAITFSNNPRFLNIDFDEVTVERVVNRDGTNEYRLNNSTVRLKDIFELLAGANIGQSGHHIISQGEADKILSANPRERREMLEDALGLKVYQYKLEESARKLEKTEENMRQVEALRREIAPHIKFLKKQVERIEKAEELRTVAVERFKLYFAREEKYLKETREKNATELARHKHAVAEIGKQIAEAKATLAGASGDKRGNRILELSQALDDTRDQRAESSRRGARLEGQIEVMERASRQSVSIADIESLATEGEVATAHLEKGTLADAVSFLKDFVKKLRMLGRLAESESDIAQLKKDREIAVLAEKELAKKEAEFLLSLEKIRADLETARSEEREKERALYDLAAKERDQRFALNGIENTLERLSLEEAEFKRELAEAAVLIGRSILEYASVGATSLNSLRDGQAQEKHELEKTKIRLEEMGAGGGDDVMKEYREASEREEFLGKELNDLHTAAASLKDLIKNLEKELSSKFNDGLDAVNVEFTKLFTLMFDGGSASLVCVQEAVRRVGIVGIVGMKEEGENEEEEEMAPPPEEFVEGVDISLSIPRKRIKSLVMLSGGERALTSIALLFAMSSVNPPPFLILDETDAALDESNSRRYGDMVEVLAKKSQLILITHNRETMSRAGILYGITMGGDGVSKVLSVKLEEAVKVAK